MRCGWGSWPRGERVILRMEGASGGLCLWTSLDHGCGAHAEIQVHTLLVHGLTRKDLLSPGRCEGEEGSSQQHRAAEKGKPGNKHSPDGLADKTMWQMFRCLY